MPAVSTPTPLSPAWPRDDGGPVKTAQRAAWRGGDDAVAAGGLGLVERGVGVAEHGSGGGPRGRSRRRQPGLAVAYWLCAHPDEALSPTGHSADLGFAPSTISTAAAAMAEAGLVDDGRQAVLPQLFWELAGACAPNGRGWPAGPTRSTRQRPGR